MATNSLSAIPLSPFSLLHKGRSLGGFSKKETYNGERGEVGRTLFL